MPPVLENPILNSPFREPQRHFRFDEDGITNEIVDERRRSTYFIPIPRPMKNVAAGAPAEQMTLSGSWTSERMQLNDNINRIRAHVAEWRRAGWPGVTATTRELLDYWTGKIAVKVIDHYRDEILKVYEVPDAQA